MPFKDWDRICRELSSPESSDADDELNLPMMQKRTPRVAELVDQMLGQAPRSTPPKGMNTVDSINPFKDRSVLEGAMRTSAAIVIQRAVRKASGASSASSSASIPVSTSEAS